MSMPEPAARRTKLDIAAVCLTALLFVAPTQFAWLKAYPDPWTLPIIGWIEQAVQHLAAYKAPFRALADAAKFCLELVRTSLFLIPWPVHMVIAVLAAYRASGWGLAIFAASVYAYALGVGKWDATLNTLALVLVSVPFALALGTALGVAAAKSRRARQIIEPVLDLMQTVPAFAYLIPAMIFLGFGPQVGLVVSVIYAAPPMARNVMLGLSQTPLEQIEASLMMGMTRRQRFFKVELPASLSQLAVGINQCVLAAFAMVIIASVIGGFNDIGWEVTSNYRRQQLGASLEAGIVVTLFAILLDRVGNGFARRALTASSGGSRLWPGWLTVGVPAVVAALALSWWLPALRVYPESLTFSFAAIADAVMANVMVVAGPALQTIKSKAVIFFMAPLEMGLVRAVNPMFWGFALTPALIAAYWGAALLLAGLAAYRCGIGAAAAVAFATTIVFFGLTGLPWPVYFLLSALVAHRLAGTSTALFVVLSLCFIMLTGLLPEALLTISLVTSAILISLLIGLPLGVLASMNRTVAAVVRAVGDFLQSVPAYVLLIPPLWFFKISEFASVIAIVAYAIVPAVRYTYEGLLGTPAAILEAARSMGMTRAQLLFRVKIPMAMPSIMLGINQTILFSLSMLVIAAMITSRDLGQQIYLALGKQSAGLGLAAGLSMALIAMSVDRVIQGWAADRKRALGLA